MTVAERLASGKRMKALWRQRKKKLIRPEPISNGSGDVQIPVQLLKLLASRPSDFRDPDQYAEVLTLAQHLLRVLLPHTEMKETS